jgi:hypothetical protein
MTTVETFGGGVHRIVVLKEDSDEVVGIVSQSRLVKFLWENGRSFPIIDQLYPQYLKDLRLGSQQVIHIKYVDVRRETWTFTDRLLAATNLYTTLYNS